MPERKSRKRGKEGESEVNVAENFTTWKSSSWIYVHNFYTYIYLRQSRAQGVAAAPTEEAWQLHFALAEEQMKSSAICFKTEAFLGIRQR